MQRSRRGVVDQVLLRHPAERRQSVGGGRIRLTGHAAKSAIRSTAARGEGRESGRALLRQPAAEEARVLGRAFRALQVSRQQGSDAPVPRTKRDGRSERASTAHNPRCASGLMAHGETRRYSTSRLGSLIRAWSPSHVTSACPPRARGCGNPGVVIGKVPAVATCSGASDAPTHQ